MRRPLSKGARDLTMGAMTAAERAAAGRASQDFEQRAEPFRREIKVHCYRMLGALHEAEDAVQESYLRAWRSHESFDGRGSFRAWLYRIATNVCLDALASSKHRERLLPDQRVPASAIVAMPEGAPATDLAWLEPYPDRELEGIADDAPNPEARYAAREAVQLAFVAAIQELPPRQRAALLLCDVLGWAAAEAGTLLGGSTAAINSALQRARATLAKRYPTGQPPMPAPPNPAQQKLLARYLRAWEGDDLDGFAALLKEDAIYTMPPWRQWFVGRKNIRDFFALAWGASDGIRLLPTAANGQPAFAMYLRSGADAPWAAHGIQVLAVDQEGVAALTLFLDPGGARLFAAFGLPRVLPEPVPAPHRV
jgi:RNA polymerase sigma-70 factor, ECF subfamily